jgi:hypothetical protein
VTSRGRHVESAINATSPKSINVPLDALRARQRAARATGARIPNLVTQLTARDPWLCEALDPDGNAVEWVFGRVHD